MANSLFSLFSFLFTTQPNMMRKFYITIRGYTNKKLYSVLGQAVPRDPIHILHWVFPDYLELDVSLSRVN